MTASRRYRRTVDTTTNTQPSHPRAATSRQLLYRLYDAGGLLLYVGRTSNWEHREASHRGGKSWWNEVARREFVPCASQAEVEYAEAVAIVVERPRHNKAVPTPDRVRTLGERARLHPDQATQALLEATDRIAVLEQALARELGANPVRDIANEYFNDWIEGGRPDALRPRRLGQILRGSRPTYDSEELAAMSPERVAVLWARSLAAMANLVVTVRGEHDRYSYRQYRAYADKAWRQRDIAQDALEEVEANLVSACRVIEMLEGTKDEPDSISAQALREVHQRRAGMEAAVRAIRGRKRCLDCGFTRDWQDGTTPSSCGCSPEALYPS